MSITINHYLQSRNSNNWIFNASPAIRWPACSPNLSPLNFFWREVEDMQYFQDHKVLTILKIRNACHQVTPRVKRTTLAKSPKKGFQMCVAIGELQLKDNL